MEGAAAEAVGAPLGVAPGMSGVTRGAVPGHAMDATLKLMENGSIR